MQIPDEFFNLLTKQKSMGYEHCESIVQKWAFVSLDLEVGEGKHALKATINLRVCYFPLHT